MSRAVAEIVRDSTRMRLWSPAFEHGATLPVEHSRQGGNIPPPLSWSGLPPGTVELALTCTDADAPLLRGAVHWIIYGIPAGTSSISSRNITSSFLVGELPSGRTGWSGPNPPPGHGVHHYYFWLYALDIALTLPSGAQLPELVDAMDGHVLAQQRLVATFATP